MDQSNYPSSNESPTARSGKSLIPIMLALMLVLGVVNIAFFVNRSKPDERIVQQLGEKERTLAELTEKYQAAVHELDALQSAQPEMTRELNTLKDALLKQKTEIEQNIHHEHDLQAAHRQIDAMVEEKNRYIAEIAGLREQLKTTELHVAAIEDEKRTLSARLSAPQPPALPGEKATTKKTTNPDDDENPLAFLSVSDIQVSLMRVNHRNREQRTRYARQTDRLKFCFNVHTNDLLPAGMETFHIRIIDPGGVTLFQENLGSGVIMNKSDRSEMRFTGIKPYIYEQADEKVCHYWEQPGYPFTEGNYDLEIYHRGRLSGKTAFRMR